MLSEKSILNERNRVRSKATKKERSSNIELLRIFAMMGVILLHCNDGRAFTYVQAGSANQYLLYVLEGICIIAVDLFVLINGHYNVEFKGRPFDVAAKHLDNNKKLRCVYTR